MKDNKIMIVLGGLLLVGVLAVALLWNSSRKPAQEAMQTKPVSNISKVQKKAEVVPPTQAPVQERVKEITVQSAEIKKPEPVVEPKREEKPVALDFDNPRAFASSRDFLASFGETLKKSNPVDRWKAFRNMGINLTNEEFGQVEKTLEPYFDNNSLSERSGRASYQLVVLGAWLAKDPASAMNWTYQLSSLQQTDETTEKYMQYVQANMGRSAGYYGFVRPCDVQINADGSWQYGLLTPNSESDMASSKIIALDMLKRWAVQDPQAASTWANNLPEGDRQAAIKCVELGQKVQAAFSNPNRGEALQSLIANDYDYTGWGGVPFECQALAREWVKSDPQAARAWADQYKDESKNTDIKIAIHAINGEGM